MRRELQILLLFLLGFGVLWFLPVDSPRFQGAVIESFRLVQWYAREHVLLCLVPAFFIAGAIGVFVNQNAVVKYFGPAANKVVSYGVASVSGSILAVCSCTVLPLFGGIYLRGAGLGPAIAFLYSGPAINVLAMVLTARVLGWQIGLARAVGAITFSVVIGALMHLFFLKEEQAKAAREQALPVDVDAARTRPLWKTAALFLCMVVILVFANWARSGDVRAVFLCCPNGLKVYSVEGRVLEHTTSHIKLLADGEVRTIPRAELKALKPTDSDTLARRIYTARWALVTAAMLALVWMMCRWMGREERREWVELTWGYAKQITPLLLAGVLAAGFFFASPQAREAGIIPDLWVQALVGDSPAALMKLLGAPAAASPAWLSALWPLWSNFFAALAGALMYFATLTEIPIVRGLMDSGMGQGPALALLLAGPALSLPSMLVINSVIGPRKTITYVGLVVVMATLTGMVWGWLS